MYRKLLHPLFAALLAQSAGLVGPLQAGEHELLLGAVFSELERQTIEAYYRDRDENKSPSRKGLKGGAAKELPPGLAKRDRLPPGLERQLQVNGRLPPGLEKRRLPDSLARRLPERRAGYERVLVDNDVLLIEAATGLILDILEDVY